MTLFDWLNEITYNKSPWEKFTNDDHALFLPWMINRFISMNSKYIELVNDVQQYNLPANKLYEFYCKSLPKQKQFFKYVKSKKDKDNPAIDILANVFMISTREAKEYYNTVIKQEIEDLVTLHTQPYTKTKAKKIKK